MPTRTGTGVAHHAVGKTAVQNAVQAARAQLGDAKPAYGLLFVSPVIDLGEALSTARKAIDAPMIGCTTAGEITEAGLVHGGVAVMLVASDAKTFVQFATSVKGDPDGAVRGLSSDLAQAKRTMAARENRHLTTVLLTDGLSGTGERLVNDLYELRMQSGTQIVGGAAGDEGRFASTLVGAHGEAATDAAAALHVFGASPWGVGVDHGLRSTTKQMRVTKADANVVYEIDGKPAFATYERHAAERGVRLTRDSASSYLVANELGVHFFERIVKARAPLSVGADGSLVCAAEIPRGSMVSILDGDPNSMIRAARSAAEQARGRLGNATAAGVLLFDCVCRGMILGDAFQREIEAVRSVFPGVPIAGFLTYGEIARSQDRLEGWHNATAVIAAIPA